jgi:hypothetical protein
VRRAEPFFAAAACTFAAPVQSLVLSTELINNGVSIEADAVLGLTARIQRFGGYATDEVGLAPEPFDARHRVG